MFGTKKFTERGGRLANVVNPLLTGLFDDVNRELRKLGSKSPHTASQVARQDNEMFMKASIAAWMFEHVTVFYSCQNWMRGKDKSAFDDGFEARLLCSCYSGFLDFIAQATVERNKFFDTRTFSANSVAVPLQARILAKFGIDYSSVPSSARQLSLTSALALCGAWIATSQFFEEPRLVEYLRPQYYGYRDELAKLDALFSGLA